MHLNVTMYDSKEKVAMSSTPHCYTCHTSRVVKMFIHNTENTKIVVTFTSETSFSSLSIKITKTRADTWISILPKYGRANNLNRGLLFK